eukprot:TRINITY_DN28834_c0_g1_i1.p2 TRINITY_DN28834_c0_g1~~TRINITY_DN28834_c0_g1_i1.p2  ORF type:complete len:137 (-),score=18.48 TRINITY_DN28834_c0_g1_i1:358-768(-)
MVKIGVDVSVCVCVGGGVSVVECVAVLVGGGVRVGEDDTDDVGSGLLVKVPVGVGGVVGVNGEVGVVVGGTVGVADAVANALIVDVDWFVPDTVVERFDVSEIVLVGGIVSVGGGVGVPVLFNDEDNDDDGTIEEE